MANQIHQHPDGTISVRVDNKFYCDTEKNFKKDFGSNLAKPPPGIEERLYEQGVRHALTVRNSVVDGGPMPWSVGDAVIGKIDDALANRQQRLDDDVKEAEKRVNDEAEEHERKAKEKIEESDAVIEVKIARDKTDREAKQTKQTDDFVVVKNKRDEDYKKMQEEYERKQPKPPKPPKPE